MKKVFIIILLGVVAISCTTKDVKRKIEKKKHKEETKLSLKLDTVSLLQEKTILHENKGHTSN